MFEQIGSTHVCGMRNQKREMLQANTCNWLADLND
jgi:hypothetical protein